jgi:hypothetical protein
VVLVRLFGASAPGDERSCRDPPLPKISVMYHVSRPLIALLVGSVAFFALWTVALKPSSSTGSGGSSGVGSYQSAIDKAHQAVASSNGPSGAHAGSVATSPASNQAPTRPAPAAATQQTTAAASAVRPIVTARRPARAATRRLGVVQEALRQHKVLALLFYNPAAADDRALKSELAAVPTHGARVLELAVPLRELARYTVVTSQVPVNASPTLVLVGRDRRATTIVGFADRFEIAQRVADALATK